MEYDIHVAKVPNKQEQNLKNKLIMFILLIHYDTNFDTKINEPDKYMWKDTNIILKLRTTVISHSSKVSQNRFLTPDKKEGCYFFLYPGPSALTHWILKLPTEAKKIIQSVNRPIKEFRS